MTLSLLPARTGNSKLHVSNEQLTSLFSKSQVDVVVIKADGTLELNDRIVLHSAHGEEIVRSIFVNDKV